MTKAINQALWPALALALVWILGGFIAERPWAESWPVALIAGLTWFLLSVAMYQVKTRRKSH